MPGITRRAFITQTATMAVSASALTTGAPSQPDAATPATADMMAKRRETLEVLLKVLPHRTAEFDEGGSTPMTSLGKIG